MSIVEDINQAKNLKRESTAKNENNTVQIGAYSISDKGVFLDPPDATLPVWICGRLDILSRTRDQDGMNWGLLVRFTDHDKTVRELNIKNELFIH